VDECKPLVAGREVVLPDIMAENGVIHGEARRFVSQPPVRVPPAPIRVRPDSAQPV